MGGWGRERRKKIEEKKERKWRYNKSLDGGAEMLVKGGKKNEGEN